MRAPKQVALHAALGRPYIRVLGTAGLLWLLIAFVHQIVLLAAAILASWKLGPEAANVTTIPGGGDEVYSRLVLGMLGSALPKGLLAAPLGVDVLFASGSSAVGVQVLEVLVNLAMAGWGTALLIAAWARPRQALARRLVSSATARLAANLCLGYGVAAQLQLSWSTGSGGEMALSMVATKLLGIDSRTYAAALEQDVLLSVGVNLVLLGLALVTGLIAGWLAVGILSRRGGLRRLRAALLPPRTRRSIAPAGAIILGLALMPLQPGVRFEETPAPAAAESAEAAPAQQPAQSPEAAAAPAVEACLPPSGCSQASSPPVPRAKPKPLPAGPSVVTIASRDNTFEYRVNNRSDFIRGVGYNPVTKGDGVDRRSARFDRDFATMSAIGINTITGWDEGEFDQVLLDKAAEYGLGVILPFELRPAWAYDDARVRRQVLDDLAKRVERYKASPALRMWGLGNEVIHGILPRGGARAQAFAAFLVQAADVVHSLDPNHPIVYRDAEDVFLEPVAKALRAVPQPRPWFVYGMNFFTTRMEEALTKGPARALRQPLLISEFSPVGLRPNDRAAGYSKLWGIVRAHRDMLLGGCVYVWSTAGPEPLDRSFGLTNEAGEPVDGSVAALTSLFTSESTAA